MSEYQYYEFLAIDRPLTKRETAELRRWSTRARITPSSFVNDYSWGGFKGDEDAWMMKYFDAFLYLANWGTHVLKLGFPTGMLDAKIAGIYGTGEAMSVARGKNRFVLTFVSESEDHEDWVEGEGQLSAFVPLRAEIAQGDHRALYLGWLLSAQNEEFDEEDVEPPVPAGLRELSAALESFAGFMRIDEDLLAIATESSAPLKPARGDRNATLSRLRRMSNEDKDSMLARVLDGETLAVVSELRRRAGADPEAEPNRGPRRTVGELLDAARKRSAERKAREAQARAEAAARRKREAELARAKFLDGLSGRESAMWEKIEKLIAQTQPGLYDEAVKLLKDLRDLADRDGDRHDFHGRLDRLRKRHSNKPSFKERLRKAALL